MASYKTFFICFILSTYSVTGLPTSVYLSTQDDSKLRDLKKYSFSDDYFTGKAKKYNDEQIESTENCERVIKSGMICQVCTDPDTDAKYETCSYASPSKKAHGYEKSKKKPEKLEKGDYQSQSKKQQQLNRRHDNEESEEVDGSSSYSGYSQPLKNYDNYNNNDDESNYNRPLKSSSSYIPESERISKDIKKHKCEEIERDGMTCMVCKDTKTGGNFEKCSFAYEPKEKVYKYSTSKNIGGPKNQKNPEKKPIEKSQSYRRSDSAEITESKGSEVAETQLVDDNGCRDVIKDSMTCKVCIDPVTRENSEQCSYSYSPDEELYAYTHSSSFGKPKKYSSSSSSSSSSSDE